MHWKFRPVPARIGIMRNVAVLPLLLLLLLPGLSWSQYRRRGTGAATANPGPYKGPAVTFHGTLKALTRKELIMDLDLTESSEDRQTLTFRLSGKTKFFKNDREIKSADVAPGTHIALDATRGGDQKLSALNVMVEPK